VGKNPPTAVIAIAAYNEPALLERALRTVVRQSYRPLRVLVSDDAGEKEVSNVVDQFRGQYPEIKWDYHRHNVNLGVAHNLVWMFSNVTEEYCLFLQHDDELILDTFLERSVELLESDSDVNVCIGNGLMEVPGGLSEPVLLFENSRWSLKLNLSWERFSGEAVAAALLAPLRIWQVFLSVFMRRAVSPYNASWSSVVFRTSAVRLSGGLTAASLIGAELEDGLDVYTNEEGFAFLHRLLSIGDAFLNYEPVSLRGKPSTSFSDSPDHPGRGRLNNVEVFALLQNSLEVQKLNHTVAKLMRAKAKSLGLRKTSPTVAEFFLHHSTPNSTLLAALFRGRFIHFSSLLARDLRKLLKFVYLPITIWSARFIRHVNRVTSTSTPMARLKYALMILALVLGTVLAVQFFR
jgi:glycosyltransferase involved in cell wall biosynthesis